MSENAADHQETARPGATGLTRRSIGILALVGCVLLLPNLGWTWSLTYHEAFSAEPAREMLQTGDWVVPRIAGVPCWMKPPLTAWVIAASMAVFGSESEFVVRLPIALAGLATAIGVGAIAAKFHGDRIGRLAALCQLTTFYSIFQSRLAEVDMLFAAAITAAMLAFLHGVCEHNGRARSRRIWIAVYFAAAGLSCLAKGPLGPALIGGPSLLLALTEKRARVWSFLFSPLGWLIGASLVLAWPALAYVMEPSVVALWQTHNLDRFTGAYSQGQTTARGILGWTFYLQMVPLLLLPWTPFVVTGLIELRTNANARAESRAYWRLMAFWFCFGFAVFTAAAWKHKHYVIPILPPASILAAIGLDRFLRRLDARTSERAERFAFAAIIVTVLLIEATVLPKYDLYAGQTRFARRLNAKCGNEAEICLVEVPNPQVIYYLRPPIRRFDHERDFVEWLGSRPANGPLVVVFPPRLAPALADLGDVHELDRETKSRNALAASLLTPDTTRVAAIRDEAKSRQ